jgi:hypothetical protein
VQGAAHGKDGSSSSSDSPGWCSRAGRWVRVQRGHAVHRVHRDWRLRARRDHSRTSNTLTS